MGGSVINQMKQTLICFEITGYKIIPFLMNLKDGCSEVLAIFSLLLLKCCLVALGHDGKTYLSFL